AGLALGAQLVETVAEIGNSSFERSPFLGAHLALVRTSVISLFRHESHVLGRRPDSPEGAPSNAGRTIGMGVLSVKETGERQALPSGRKIGALGLVNCGALGVPARGCSDHPKGARWQALARSGNGRPRPPQRKAPLPPRSRSRARLTRPR